MCCAIIPVYHCVYGWGNCQNSLVCWAIIPVYHLSLALVYGYGNRQNSFMCCTIIPVYHLSSGVWLREMSEQFSVLYSNTSFRSLLRYMVEGIIRTVSCVAQSYQFTLYTLVCGWRNCQNSLVCCTIIPVYHLSPGVWLRELSEQFNVLYSHTSLQSTHWCFAGGNCQNNLVCCTITLGRGSCQDMVMCCTLIPVYYLSSGILSDCQHNNKKRKKKISCLLPWKQKFILQNAWFRLFCLVVKAFFFLSLNILWHKSVSTV